MRNGLEQLTASHIPWALKHSHQNSDLRICVRQFAEAHPDAGGKDFWQSLNPHSLKVVTAYVDPPLAQAQQDQRFQFKRFGYFVADRLGHLAGA
jgi:glutaminyl-tRNA synthetase